MTSSPGCQLPDPLDTLLLKAAIHPDQQGLEAWQQLRPHFSVDAAHPGQWSLLPLVHRTLCATGAPDPDRERLAGQRRYLRIRWARGAGAIRAALRRLEEVAIPVMLVGEAARAQRIDGEDSSLRDLQTIHLLVHACNLDRAAALLNPADPIQLVCSASDRLAHPGPAGDSAWEWAEPATLAGSPVLRPSATDLLLHTLVDGTRLSHRGRIRWAADAALLIRAGDIRWDRLQEEAKQGRVPLTTATALAYLSNALAVPLPPEALARPPGGLRYGRERLINRLWSERGEGPCRRNAMALVLAQSAAEPPWKSLWHLGLRVAGVGAAETASTLRHGMEILRRIRQPPPLFGTSQDRPVPVRSTRSVVVASMPRTGSTLLCSALERTGLVGVPLEYLLPRFLESGHRVLGAPHPTRREQRRRLFRRLRLQREWWGYREIEPSTLPAYIDGLVARRSSANGVFGLKVFWNHFRDAEAMGFHPSQLPQPITWILLDRRDRIAQCVSLVKASQSGTFALREPSGSTADRTHYDDGELLRAWQVLREGTSAWNGYFRARGITPIRVWYEDLASDYEGTITGLLEALGFQEVPVPPPIHRRQADAVNAQWIAAFRRNHPELTLLRTSGDGPPGQP